MTEAQGKPAEPRLDIEKYRDAEALSKYVKGKTLVGIVRLGEELESSPPGKAFIEAMKLWERVLMSMPTEKAKAAPKRRRSGEDE